MAVQPGGDLLVGHTLGGIENHPRALNITPRGGYLTRAALTLIALLSAQLDPIAARPGHDHLLRRDPKRSFT
jgi:hypothetical protein